VKLRDHRILVLALLLVKLFHLQLNFFLFFLIEVGLLLLKHAAAGNLESLHRGENLANGLDRCLLDGKRFLFQSLIKLFGDDIDMLLQVFDSLGQLFLLAVELIIMQASLIRVLAEPETVLELLYKLISALIVHQNRLQICITFILDLVAAFLYRSINDIVDLIVLLLFSFT